MKIIQKDLKRGINPALQPIVPKGKGGWLLSHPALLWEHRGLPAHLLPHQFPPRAPCSHKPNHFSVAPWAGEHFVQYSFLPITLLKTHKLLPKKNPDQSHSLPPQSQIPNGHRLSETLTAWCPALIRTQNQDKTLFPWPDLQLPQDMVGTGKAAPKQHQEIKDFVLDFSLH